ncbi:hypothetical protein H4684_004107 [Desulfomicrobium macestii]|uniref:Uncharacterized protein n=2 Tax=Desulfomicrobium TaxID=898 RepID=A0A8G2FE88_DESNO|nr:MULTISPECIES: hypothetical protein [Desulfomicrobium]MBE1427410.1 hypothetical protein [Desulfomicrobium macestii]SFL70518.1 hypothetical protein SAMN05421830_10568 [Desulfomicrobium norvegicum]
MRRFQMSACLLLMLSVPSQILAADLIPPRGYYARLEFTHQGQSLSFGPFVGYYFKPLQGDDLSRLTFVCYNEGQFYTDQLPDDTLLYRGEAVLSTLARVRPLPRSEQRITPLFFADAPQPWLQQRPTPQEEYLHFHSAYDQSGAVYSGYWLRHEPVTTFSYNMGGRLSKDSPLRHQAKPGDAQNFPRIIEFDKGP